MTRPPSPTNRSARSRRPFCCFGCLAFAALLVIPVYLAFTPPKPPPPLPLSEAQKVDASIAQKRTEVEKLAHDVSAGRRTLFKLVLREAEINRMLETDERLRKAMQKANVERAWVTVGDGKVNATAIRPDSPSSLTVTVVPEIDPKQGLHLRIDGVEVGRLGVGAVEAVRKAAQNAVSKMMANSLLPEARFEAVRVADGEITLTGSTK